MTLKTSRMDQKLNPLQIVAREMAQHTRLTEEQVAHGLQGALGHLMERAAEAIACDPESFEAVRLARQYQAVSEAVLFLGTQLIAFEDIEAEDEADDECNPRN